MEAVKCQEDYRIGTPPATPSLGSILEQRIRRDGPLGFPDFMAEALYHPALGYYAKGSRQVGRAGDFFTSVSVGPLFGALLARRFLRDWKDRGCPDRWRIIECGAHDGTLAADVLGALEEIDEAAFRAVEYVIPEPLPALQAAQRKTSAAFENKVRFVSDLSRSEPLPGIAFGNELIDALPFHLIERRDGRWVECGVDSTDGGFEWVPMEIQNPDLLAAIEPLGNGFPDGYRSEVRTNLRAFLAPLAAALQDGLMIWIDYGFARPEFYHPDRRSGTLRTFSKHRAGENPLDHPGEADITAHVDFTALANVAIALGARPIEFQNQGSWVTAIARDWLLEQEENPQAGLLRQFQTLTHPGHLGRSFHAIELSWRATAAVSDPTALQHRLFGDT